MPSPFVQVLLNYPRTELKRTGVSKHRPASAMVPGKFQDDADPAKKAFVRGALPYDVWREPHSGVLMLRPTPMAPNFWEDAGNTPNRMLGSAWRFGSNTYVEDSATGSLMTARVTPTTAFSPVTLADAVIDAMLAYLDSVVVWVAEQVGLLAENEGFSVWVYPMGIDTDRASEYMAIGFGGRYTLVIQMNGVARLWSKNAAGDDMLERTEFRFADGGVDHTKPYQLTVVPWGFGITFMFSQNQAMGGGSLQRSIAGSGGAALANYFYEPAKYGESLDWNSDKLHYVKTKTAKLAIGLRSIGFNYKSAWSRVRYPASATIKVMAERLDAVRDYADPALTYVGFVPKVAPTAPCTITPSALANDDAAFDKATDDQLVVKLVLASGNSPTLGRIYSPELWGYNVEIPAQTHTPGWTPIDVSADWSMIRIQRTAASEVSRCEIRLDSRAGDYDRLLRYGGPVRVNLNSVPVFDGYCLERTPTLDGHSAIALDQMECRDMWTRLDERLVGEYKPLDKAKVVDVVTDLIKRTGFLPTEIEVVDPSGGLAALAFGGFVDAGDQLFLNQDARVGDVLREILGGFNTVPIRLRWVNGKWKLYAAPQYTQQSSVKKLLLRSAYQTGAGDAARWAANEFYCLSSAEFTVRESGFNGLIARASSGTGPDAEGIQGIIDWARGDPKSVNDPSSPEFIGRMKVEVMNPQDLADCRTQGDVNRKARARWDQRRHGRHLLEVLGEWNETIDCDDFFWLIGSNQSRSRVSYGVWRIEALDAQIELDPASGADRRWSTRASYALTYVGARTDGNTPMFTADSNLPIR